MTPPVRPVFSKPSRVTTAFATALGALLSLARGEDGDKPRLILLGDVLDLQFARREDAFASARGFLQALWHTRELHGQVLATAGNHDHALWSDARLSLEADTIADCSETRDFRKATPAFGPTPAADSRLLSALICSAGFTGGVDLRYPNLGFHNQDRAVLLHHGHFVENEYRLISSIKDNLAKTPREFVPYDDLSAENAGWIDFFWSTLGDAAGLGRSAEQLYQNLLTSTGFRRLSAHWAENLAELLADHMPMGGRPGVRETLRLASRVGFDVTLGKFRDTERYGQVDALSAGGYEGLRWYLDGPAWHQTADELSTVPDDMTFVFGHTHKPFSDRVGGTSYARPVKTYNTGGWTLNGPRLDTREGAAMLLIDEDLNCALLRLFATPENGRVRPAHVETLSDTPGAAAFADQIEGWLSDDAVRPAWEALTGAALKAYRKRQDLLLTLTGEDRGPVPRAQAAG